MRLPGLTAPILALALVFPVSAADSIDPAKAKEEDGVLWFDAKLLTLEGQGWTGEALKSPFDRLPAKAEGKVRDAVWGLSRDSAGICVRFATDSPAIHCRWTLTKANLAMPHMAATGVSGVDLYVKTDGGWRWLGTGRPTQQTNTAALVSGLPQAAARILPVPAALQRRVVGRNRRRQGREPLSPLPRDAKRNKPIVF